MLHVQGVGIFINELMCLWATPLMEVLKVEGVGDVINELWSCA